MAINSQAREYVLGQMAQTPELRGASVGSQLVYLVMAASLSGAYTLTMSANLRRIF